MVMILLVEDHEDVAEMLSRRLKRHGFDITVAVDGGQAVEAFDGEHPDLVLLDMNLPVMDGWSVARHLKADSRSAGVPLIALTAHAAAEDRDRALRSGCDDYHPKPIDFSRLLSQIEAALGQNSVQKTGRAGRE